MTKLFIVHAANFLDIELLGDRNGPIKADLRGTLQF